MGWILCSSEAGGLVLKAASGRSSVGELVSVPRSVTYMSLHACMHACVLVCVCVMVCVYLGVWVFMVFVGMYCRGMCVLTFSSHLFL